MKHHIHFIKRYQTLPCLLLQPFLLGMLLAESLAIMASFGSSTVVAYAHGTEPEKGAGRPNLFISESHLGGDHFHVGDDVTFIIVVGNSSHAGPTISPITVSASVPAEIRNLRASGQNWKMAMSDTKSPTVITARYLGHHSVHGGETLPAIQISGKLTEDTIPRLTSVARVHTECNCDISKSKATDMIFVEKKGHGQQCNQCKEQKEDKGCQEREECQDKSGTSTQGESPVTNTINPMPTPTPAISYAIAVSSVAISNTYNIFSNAGNIPGLGSIGNNSDPNIPGLPNTGSDPNIGGQ